MRAILALSLLVAAPAIAEDAPAAGTTGKTIDCYCTDTAGDRVELGEVICLSVGGRMFLARCEMSLNNPMWREVQEGCTTSWRAPISPPDRARPGGKTIGS